MGIFSARKISMNSIMWMRFQITHFFCFSLRQNSCYIMALIEIRVWIDFLPWNTLALEIHFWSDLEDVLISWQRGINVWVWCVRWFRILTMKCSPCDPLIRSLNHTTLPFVNSANHFEVRAFKNINKLHWKIPMKKISNFEKYLEN